MLKRNITFEDLDGNKVTETYHFNLMRSELLQLELDGEGGSLHDVLLKIIESEDRGALVKEFKRIILCSFGERSEDGKRFIKSEEATTAFSQTQAFDQLFFELATDANKCADFVMGVMPKDLAAEAAKAMPQDKPKGLPPRPPVK